MRATTTCGCCILLATRKTRFADRERLCAVQAWWLGMFFRHE